MNWYVYLIWIYQMIYMPINNWVLRFSGYEMPAFLISKSVIFLMSRILFIFYLEADNVDDHTNTYNWFHSSRAERVYRALTTRFLVCSWTAYAFPHHCLFFFNAMFNQFSLERGFIFHLVLANDSPLVRILASSQYLKDYLNARL